MKTKSPGRASTASKEKNKVEGLAFLASQTPQISQASQTPQTPQASQAFQTSQTPQTPPQASQTSLASHSFQTAESGAVQCCGGSSQPAVGQSEAPGAPWERRCALVREQRQSFQQRCWGHCTSTG